MVFFFTTIDPSYTVYVGRDKFENEKLIEWGWPEDIWFHVDDMSSAHVYLRLLPNQTIDDIPLDVLNDCCQLVKANSIAGSKLASARIVYTPWSNLRKEANYEVGQVGFKKSKKVKKKTINKDREIIKRLEKTKVERNDYDYAAERRKRDNVETREQKRLLKEKYEREEKEKMEREKERELKSYDRLFSKENMSSGLKLGDSNYKDYEDDFM